MQFNEELINQIWEKGLKVEGVDAKKFRKDACGAWIARNKLESTESDFGWSVDYIYPRSKGGGDNIENLRPLNIQNKNSKGDSYPAYVACLISQDEKNIRRLRTIVVNKKKQRRLNELFGEKNDSEH